MSDEAIPDVEPAPAEETVVVDPQHVRMAEALLFAAAEPLDANSLRKRLPDGADIGGILATLAENYAGRGVNLRKVADRWSFFTAPDLAFLLATAGLNPSVFAQTGAALTALADGQPQV